MKHEQAILVVLAYVIGFTTSFIAFSINDGNAPPNNSKKYSEHKNIELVARAEAIQGVSTLENDEGFFVLREDEERILSVQVPDSTVIDSKGFHKKIVFTTISQDGRFVYYCAQVDSAEECLNFIYSLDEDKVYSVNKDGEQAVTDFSVAESAVWLNSGVLKFAGTVSKNSTTPWLLK